MNPVRSQRFASAFAALSLAAVFGAIAAFTSVANGYYVFVIANMAQFAVLGIGLNILIGLTGQVSFGHVGFYAIGAYAVAILTTAVKLNFWHHRLPGGVARAARARPLSRHGHHRVRLHR